MLCSHYMQSHPLVNLARFEQRSNIHFNFKTNLQPYKVQIYLLLHLHHRCEQTFDNICIIKLLSLNFICVCLNDSADTHSYAFIACVVRVDENCNLLEIIYIFWRCQKLVPEPECSSKTLGTESTYLFKDLCCPLLMANQAYQTKQHIYSVSMLDTWSEAIRFILWNLLMNCPFDLTPYISLTISKHEFQQRKLLYGCSSAFSQTECDTNVVYTFPYTYTNMYFIIQQPLCNFDIITCENDVK